MQMPLQITFKNMDSSPAVEARIQAKAAKLERFFNRIMRCHVVVEAPHRHQRQGELYRVAIDITVPGGEIAVDREHRKDHSHEDVYVAIRDAFDAAARQLEDHARRTRGDVKSHAEQMSGKIVRMFPDYGFIETSDGQEVYFHRNSVVGDGYDLLAPGREVRLVIAEGESLHGSQATTVEPTGGHRRSAGDR